jgi:hypothetical protein
LVRVDIAGFVHFFDRNTSLNRYGKRPAHSAANPPGPLRHTLIQDGRLRHFQAGMVTFDAGTESHAIT